MSNEFCMTPLLGMYLKSSFFPMLLFCINIYILHGVILSLELTCHVQCICE